MAPEVGIDGGAIARKPPGALGMAPPKATASRAGCGGAVTFKSVKSSRSSILSFIPLTASSNPRGSSPDSAAMLSAVWRRRSSCSGDLGLHSRNS